MLGYVWVRISKCENGRDDREGITVWDDSFIEILWIVTSHYRVKFVSLKTLTL